MKTYVIFEPHQVHKIKGKTIDCNCVAVIDCMNSTDARKVVFDLFGTRFCHGYPERDWKKKIRKEQKKFSGGYINVN